MKMCCKVTLLLIILTITACSTTQSRFVPLGSAQSPKPEDHPVQIFREKEPDRPFTRIDVHLEKTHFISSDFADALPKLRKEARLSGADAVIDIKERKSSVGETQIYHVTATGIKFIE